MDLGQSSKNRDTKIDNMLILQGEEGIFITSIHFSLYPRSFRSQRQHPAKKYVPSSISLVPTGHITVYGGVQIPILVSIVIPIPLNGPRRRSLKFLVTEVDQPKLVSKAFFGSESCFSSTP
ncbi:unnamed protein product [Lepeophtheirus salmonis]|uniref:(salmon louse) hypothetical protein n=1 Tax=Lepeophtheirus salmonis TaxID=72036 RepID=A0A7R8CAQ9_LEPSM|nr:unnamed protein product [Lepeophtheirus salmonis]CAF2751207.1 unnamed protein product [Lepeophtheirus salmonis]